jgi:hypothetical protein
MYPNPAKNTLAISSDVDIIQVNIYNSLGQNVSTYKGDGNLDLLDISGLSSGNYIVEILADFFSQKIKFIKQ